MRATVSPSPRPYPAATRVLLTGCRFAGEGVTRRGIGFQPVREMIFWQWLAVPVGCWLTGCGAGWCAGISKDGPSARRLKAYATDGGPLSPSPRPYPAATRVLLTGCRFAGEGVTRRGIGFQPVLEFILRQRLAVSAGRWLTGRCAGWCGGISKDGPSARRLKAYATDGGPVRPHPGPLPQSRGCCLSGVGWWERGDASWDRLSACP